jgi:hypothetical protein
VSKVRILPLIMQTILEECNKLVLVRNHGFFFSRSSDDLQSRGFRPISTCSHKIFPNPCLTCVLVNMSSEPVEFFFLCVGNCFFIRISWEDSGEGLLVCIKSGVQYLGGSLPVTSVNSSVVFEDVADTVL